ncbi:MAG: nicotinate-nucleotide adenylyltransferase [Acidimicrobiales bacterium]
MERIGIFGGTFDPVHVGHLVAACWCRDALELDRVLLVVANEPWQKAGTRELSAAEERFAIVAAAVEGVNGLEASHMEIDRGGPSYTADTIHELRAAHPGAQLFLVVGSDVAAELGTWHRFGEIKGLATLVVVDRSGVVLEVDPRDQWGEAGSVRHVRIPTLEISSSELRERLRRGRSVDFLIPEPAIRRIHRLGLYSVGR